MAAESSSAGERGGLRLAMSACTKRVRRRSALDIRSSRGGSALYGAQLQHLGIGDAHAHRRGGLPDRISAKKPKLEDAAVVGRQAVENRADVDLVLLLGGLGRVALVIEFHQDGAVPLAPDIRQHAPGCCPKVRL